MTLPLRIGAVGFTGSSERVTRAQRAAIATLVSILKDAGATTAHHGMCIHGDAYFHHVARRHGFSVEGHPGVRDDGTPWKRAPCSGLTTEWPPQRFLVRNRHIICLSDLMLACPRTRVEQPRGSGTWASIRYARATHTPLVLVWPDGSMTFERLPGITTLDELRSLAGRQ